MKLILVRHGESQQFFNRIIAGPLGCRGLTERGVIQAGVLAERLRTTSEVRDCAVFLTSPLLRARQTAAVLAPVLPGLPIVEDEALCELSPGDSDGMSKEEARARYEPFDLLADPTRPIAPNGDSWFSFTTRVRSTFALLAVTHAGFIVASLLVLFDIPRPGTGAYLDPDFTSLTEWQYTSGKWKLARYNDASHLRQD